MSQYVFTPNSLARQVFNLRSEKYEDSSVTDLMQKTFGIDNVREHFHAFSGPAGVGRTVVVHATLNPKEPDSTKTVYVPVGTLSQKA